ncbi:hypothetical protein OFL57_30220 [Pseudomonas aeruginosa]|uniref:hypothetical protein n=1 Tax=Pseudomonas aeruginosa TaxID=287 RepID=UPI000F8433BE|nr:hypothetical protein [Pseudomonas aeruginosa]MCL8375674.1 hypothetical protein [Pseudomonas aeruginosa]MCV6512603.1 hypothetical protein [Pseudomonas aeruginosa]MDA3333000.1 hypothetical protein [Pseudomonas aeruginosa]MDE9778255.1 hypothetical protein [Pseudomonas aeruginosa]MDI3895918.1 hypothetical protein [Pseudomonas aeruginosa]
MEDFVGLLSVAPVVGAAVSVLAAFIGVWRRSKADENFIKAVSDEIKAASAEINSVPEEARFSISETTTASIEEPEKLVEKELTEEAERLGDNDPALVRHLYYVSLLNARRLGFPDKNASGIFISAMNDLAAKDRKYIRHTLKHNTDKGRARYLDKIFHAALKIVT